MKTLLLASLILLVSCGKKNYHSTTYVENPYDDNGIKVSQVIQDARLKAIEDRLNAYETNFDEVIIEFSSELNNLETTQNSLKEATDANLLLVNNALTMLQSKQLKVEPICPNSEEHLLKSQDSIYAVFMVSNNYGTFLGKLSENVTYQTTDNVHAVFQIVNNKVVCL